jgi:hypothetical protein
MHAPVFESWLKKTRKPLSTRSFGGRERVRESRPTQETDKIGTQGCIPCAYVFYMRYMTHGLDVNIADEKISVNGAFQSSEEREDWPSVKPRGDPTQCGLLL